MSSTEGWGTLAEKFSAAANLRREKMRIISGITAFNLIEEGKFEDAETYRKPLVEVKTFSVEDLAQNLAFGFVPGSTQTKEIANQMIQVAKVASQEPASIQKPEIEQSKQKLLELLHALRSKRKS